eukprot:jgi/Undpi1/11742/HiC_scaffold_37.g14037.m1
MASDAILQRLQAEFDSPPEALQTLVGLLSEGAPVPYVYRHCRERVPGMSEDRMHAVEERLHQLEETEQRKDAIRQQAEARGTLTEDLQKTLEGSFDQDLLDDIYQSLRPRRRTPAMVAEEQGLGALAQAVQHRQLGEKSLVDVAAEYVDAEKGLETTERVLEGVALILAERFASDPDVRDTFRRELSKGILKATAVQPGRRGAQRYKQFFDMSEPVRRIQPQRMLALRRAEREGVLKVELCLPEGREKEILRERFAADVEAGSVLAEFLDVVFQTAYDAHLRKACERDIRRRIKERADRETVRNTVRTMRSLLMAPPLGGKKVLSLRATSMTLWAALVEEDGGMAEGKTITLGLQEARKAKKPRKPKAAAKPKDGEAPAENAEAKAADGEAPAENAEAAPETPDTASAETPAAETPAAETPAAETPAAETPAAETPTTEPPTENAAEAAPAEAATTNTGPAEATPAEATPVEEAPAETAEASADAPAPAEATPAEATPAEATADSTETEATPEGGEPSAEAATPEGEAAPEAAPTEPAAPAMSEEERKAKNEVLRAAGVNWRMAEARGAKIEDLLGKNDLRFQQEDVDETTPEAAARSILRDLAAAGSDPRGEMAIAANEGITSLGQLQNQMELKARVTNLTDFGAFVDVGIGQDGLVHISQIPGKRRSEENALRIGEAVTVWVLGVDLEKRKISLSMFPPRQEGEGRRGGGGRRRSGRFEGERGQERGRGRGGRDGGGRGRGGRDGGSRDGGGRGRGGRDGDRRGRTPRVITVESERKLEEAKGHKGEFKSLSGLRALINKDKKSDEG